MSRWTRTVVRRVEQAMSAHEPPLWTDDLARSLGVPESEVQAWLDMVSAPDDLHLQLLPDVLHVSAIWLLDGEGLSFQTPDDL